MKSNVWLRGLSLGGISPGSAVSTGAIIRLPSTVAPTSVLNIGSGLQGTVIENLTIDAIGNAASLTMPAIKYNGGAQQNYARAIRIANSFGIGIQVTNFAYTNLQLRD